MGCEFVFSPFFWLSELGLILSALYRFSRPIIMIMSVMWFIFPLVECICLLDIVFANLFLGILDFSVIKGYGVCFSLLFVSVGWSLDVIIFGVLLVWLFGLLVSFILFLAPLLFLIIEDR